MKPETLLDEATKNDPARVAAALRAVRELDAAGREDLGRLVVERLEALPAQLAAYDDSAELPAPYYDTTWLPYLAASLRLRKAHGILARLLACKAQKRHDPWGDAITEDGARFLADTFDGDLTAIRGLVLDEAALVYSRIEGLNVLRILFARGDLARADTLEIWAAAAESALSKAPLDLDEEIDEDDRYFAYRLLGLAADFGVWESRARLLRISELGLLDWGVIDRHDFEKRLVEGAPMISPPEITPIGDVWECVGGWNWFQERTFKAAPPGFQARSESAKRWRRESPQSLRR